MTNMYDYEQEPSSDYYDAVGNCFSCGGQTSDRTSDGTFWCGCCNICGGEGQYTESCQDEECHPQCAGHEVHCKYCSGTGVAS